MGKIRIYGDSFSYKYWLQEEDTYAYKLAQLLQMDYANNSFPALCNTEIFDRFLNDINEFQSGDVIVYQFSTPSRVGYKFENGAYYSTAGLRENLEDTVRIMNQWAGGREKFNVKDEDIINLYNYVSVWHDKTAYYQWNSVDKIMKFISNKTGIKYVYLFLDELFDTFVQNNPNVIRFPYDKHEDNNAIIHWAWHDKLTLYHSGITTHDEIDSHPNSLAHSNIAAFIEYKLKHS